MSATVTVLQPYSARVFRVGTAAILSLLAACATAPVASLPKDGRPLVAHLGVDGRDAAFDALARSFARSNPGHALAWLPRCERLEPHDAQRIAFVQRGRARALLLDTDGTRPGASGEAGVGDLLLVHPGTSLVLSSPLDLLVFELPHEPAPTVPILLRPDDDARIVSEPGGCATESDAYRRLVLTWRGKPGPYAFEGLNAHRVRIADSFTHYHPAQGGFDELYLVQAATPGARILTSAKVDRIEQPLTVTRAEAATLLVETPVRSGDLVLLPRTMAHRGLGGILAHVITVPGFVTGAEIGVDHHLRAINEHLGLEGADALPLHAAASIGPVVR